MRMLKMMVLPLIAGPLSNLQSMINVNEMGMVRQGQ